MAERGTLADELRRAIVARELNRHRLARLSGLPYSVVHRFMGGADVSLATLDRLCNVAGVRVTLLPAGSGDHA